MIEEYVKGKYDYIVGTLYTPRFHGDDRRLGWFDLFGDAQIKDVNIVRIPSKDTLVAWHRHVSQSDYWFVLQGGLQVGLALRSNTPGNRVLDYSFVYLTPEYGAVLKIDPPTWHGYRSLEDNTILMYGLTKKYTGEDEYRCSLDDMGVNWYLGAR